MSRAAATAWLDKVARDIDAVRRALMPMPGPNLEIAAYHTQQAAEKAVKALLVHLRIAYPVGREGHDINMAAAAIPAEHSLAQQASALAPLSPWATAWRYPADDPATAAPPPPADEIARWLERIETFAHAVAQEIERRG